LSGLVTDEVLVELFGGFLGFEAGRVVNDHMGRSRRFCHLWFTSMDHAFSALNAADGRVLLGKRLRVTFTVPQQTLANFDATL
jgi:RNA recognition motif-containing protein